MTGLVEAALRTRHHPFRPPLVRAVAVQASRANTPQPSSAVSVARTYGERSTSTVPQLSRPKPHEDSVFNLAHNDWLICDRSSARSNSLHHRQPSDISWALQPTSNISTA